MNELVSIIMPSYNTAKFIGQTIQSVLSQTYSNWELIIVDDCSTDDTDFVVAQYKDERIKYLKNEKNCGAAISRNLALLKANGKWIAFLDSDDIWMPDKLEKQINFMEKNGYSFTYTMYREIDENGKQLNKIVSGPRKISKHKMYNYCWMGCLTVIYDSIKAGTIQIRNLKKNNDYAMWLKVIKKCKCYLLPEILAEYRKRDGSISNQSKIGLIKYHYYLFRISENMCVARAIFYTLKNLIFGVWKKFRYVKKGNEK